MNIEVIFRYFIIFIIEKTTVQFYFGKVFQKYLRSE